MFAINGNRPGPFQRGQSYSEIVKGAQQEGRRDSCGDLIGTPADKEGNDLEILRYEDQDRHRAALDAALSRRSDRLLGIAAGNNQVDYSEDGFFQGSLEPLG